MSDALDGLADATTRLMQSSYLHGRTAALAEVSDLLLEDERAGIPCSRERILAALNVVCNRTSIPERLQ